MNRFLPVLILLCIGQSLSAQYIYTIKADSVKITNTCDTAELILENHTQNVPGFLYNKGRGRTEFRRGAVKLNDSMFIIGGDTLKMKTAALNGLSVNNGNVVLGQDVGQAGDPAALLSPREIPLNGFPLNIRGLNTSYAFMGNTGTGDDNVINVTSNSNSYRRICVTNTSNGYAAGAGGLYYNDAGQILQFYMGSTTNLAVPNGALFRTSGPGGFNIVADVGPIAFGKHRYIGANEFARFTNSGNFGLGTQTPTAILHIKAGTAASGTAPLKLTAGVLMTTPEDGAVEYDGTDYYVTQNTTRYTLTKTLSGQITTNFGGAPLNAFSSVPASLTVPGAAVGDVVNVSANTGTVNPASIIITAYITTANTVTVQAYNASNSAITLASDTYKVKVIK